MTPAASLTLAFVGAAFILAAYAAHLRSLHRAIHRREHAPRDS